MRGVEAAPPSAAAPRNKKSRRERSFHCLVNFPASSTCFQPTHFAKLEWHAEFATAANWTAILCARFTKPDKRTQYSFKVSRRKTNVRHWSFEETSCSTRA